MSVTIVSMVVRPIPKVEISMDNIPVMDENTQEEYEKLAIHRLIRKLDWRIIPFMFLLEVLSYINRINIGHAELMGIESDLNLSQSEINWSVALFFLAYLIFELPSNILMRSLGPTRYLSLSMLAWGGIAVGMAFIKNARELMALRFLLGVAQSGFFPSIIIYFSLWYRKREQIMRIAILFGGAMIASALGSIVAYGFRRMDGIRGMNGWQWMFLIEGLPVIPLSIITCLFLHNIPDTVQWLNIREKILLTNLLRRDTGIANDENARLSWRQLLYAFIDWKIYLYALIDIGNSGVIKYLSTYFPLLVKDMASSDSTVHLIAAPPYILAFVCCLLSSYSSSRRNEHGFHLMFCLFIALLGFILMLTLVDRGKAALYVSSCIACCGIYSALPLLLSWLTNNVGGHTKKAIAVGFVLGTGQIGGIILPLLSHNESTDRRINLICIGAVAASLILTAILRICLWLENRRRSRLSSEEYDREAAIKEPCDWHPQVRYLL